MKYTRTPASRPYLIDAARRSSFAGTFTRSLFGIAASISCVSAPYAQTRPQYKRPHNTVETTTNPENRYQARLYLSGGRFRSVSRKTSLIETRLLFVKPR